MAKIKQTYKGKLTSAGFGGGNSPSATFVFETLPQANADGVSYQPPEEMVTLPIEAKRLSKLINVTDVEITITVTPKGAKKARKARKAKNATVETTAVPTHPTEA